MSMSAKSRYAINQLNSGNYKEIFVGGGTSSTLTGGGLVAGYIWVPYVIKLTTSTQERRQHVIKSIIDKLDR